MDPYKAFNFVINVRHFANLMQFRPDFSDARILVRCQQLKKEKKKKI